MTPGSPSLGGADVLLAPGLVEWNERRWGLSARRVEYLSEGRSPARLRAVLYTDGRGRIRQPRLDPYLALSFESSAPEGGPQRERQWLSAASQLAADLADGRLHGAGNLPPGLGDARPFAWGGLTTAVRYTYTGPLPHDAAHAEAAVRKRMSKARRAGYTFEPRANADDLQRMLDSTGARQNFSYGLSSGDVDALTRLLGHEVFRCHTVRDPLGEVVSAGARLVQAGGVALDWVQGTEPRALNDGAVQLMYAGVLQDLDEMGATSFDFGGANIAAVARAKSSWGFRLTPYVSISRPSVKQLALQVPAVRSLALRIKR
ncbi:MULTISPECIES: GNAT family N-acetyltransferase [unclassified Microbacterium]|uniref:GNAT family N-acetyltransferase n=1 Tax=unclassified Microbacterium TaxID=2609290 RepID=UPI0024696ED6|nr:MULTISPECIES: GNAT family N-acetyltransferase [unclassified Microbacterium]MDH5134402.1 GNAT family N-acetyltransferase [Microbacterium sp. RD10]MDH5136767.1 GNAT family N-acetyltransferase [Microbacterium sp. RD11]MDH5145671.1 GNAT family N-acetyltransferase [Microbacterium sp. RD12]MDH5155186.1 GNAT family N-acetyltransferase [Microbacterium sp. RD06]MDH5166702.1 GNAT family N-acetyltransferase [Microbacterium sp. RD02]